MNIEFTSFLAIFVGMSLAGYNLLDDEQKWARWAVIVSGALLSISVIGVTSAIETGWIDNRYRAEHLQEKVVGAAFLTIISVAVGMMFKSLRDRDCVERLRFWVSHWRWH